MMFVLKRIAACIVDYAIMLLPALYQLVHAANPTNPHAPHGGIGAFSRAGVFVSLLAPALILGAMTGLTGRTPGKLLFFLRVHDHSDDPPGLANGVLRELAKILLIATLYGIFYALASVLRDGQVLYDTWLGLEVEDLRPSGLTETQKKFRKYMREKQRRERQGRG